MNPASSDMRAQLLAALRRRGAPLWELPVPTADKETEQDEGNAPPDRHTWAGDGLLRMLLRMGRALRRLGLKEGDTLALWPDDTLPHLMLAISALLHGHHLHLLNDTAEEGESIAPALPADARLLICPPRHRRHCQAPAAEAGVKLATLGEHWQGSFFMLQMVQQVDEQTLEALASDDNGDTPAAAITLADGTRLQLDALLQQAGEWADEQELAQAPALLVSLPPLQSAPLLSAMLAALLQDDVPLFRIPASRREEALAALPDALPAKTWLLGDATFIEQVTTSTGAATRFHDGRRIIVP